MKYCCFIIILALIFGCDKATSPNEDYDYHWKLKDSPIYIDSCFTVSAGEILKIDPGVEVLFKASEINSEFQLDSLNVGMILIHGKMKAIGSKNNPIVFTKENSEGSWGNIVFENSMENNTIKYCELSYFHSTKINDTVYAGGIVFYNSDGSIKNNFLYAIGLNSGIYCNNSSPQIKSNKISFGLKTDLERPVGYRGTGIKCKNNSAPFIYNNVIFRGSYSVNCYDNSSPTIVNNTFIIWSMGEVCIKSTSNSFPQVINTLMVSNDYEGDKVCLSSSSDSSINVSYSVFMQDDHPNNYTDNGNNIITDEIGFTENSNYRLSSLSPCINTGSRSVPNLTNSDIDGHNRIIGSNIDIGASEFQGYGSKNE